MLKCAFENGDTVSLRHVTVNAIIVRDNRVLLGKRGNFRGKPISESGKWACIGGFLDRDENLVNAVKREVMEESGWEVDHLTLLRINDNPFRPKEDRQNVDMIFFGTAVREVGKHNEEVKELAWFPLDSLPDDADFAFDHGDDVKLYVRYIKEKFSLPVLG